MFSQFCFILFYITFLSATLSSFQTCKRKFNHFFRYYNNKVYLNKFQEAKYEQCKLLAMRSFHWKGIIDTMRFPFWKEIELK
jgi:hypothetical protein